MIWQDRMRRLGHYRDLPLLVRIMYTSLKVSFSPTHSLIHLADPERRGKIEDEDKITRYVDLCSYVRNRLGLRNTCLLYSILLSRMLREHGLNARINFGARKSEQGRMIGHCWVTVDEGEVPPDWQVIFRYPSSPEDHR